METKVQTTMGFWPKAPPLPAPNLFFITGDASGEMVKTHTSGLRFPVGNTPVDDVANMQISSDGTLLLFTEKCGKLLIRSLPHPDMGPIPIGYPDYLPPEYLDWTEQVPKNYDGKTYEFHVMESSIEKIFLIPHKNQSDRLYFSDDLQWLYYFDIQP
jgi:hypothetical protein